MDPVTAFAALAHPHRLAVVQLLMRHYPARLAAGEIGVALDLRASTLSGYLAQLMAAGLITQERRGTSLLYAADPVGAGALSNAWLGAICGGRGWPAGYAAGRRVRNLMFLGHGNGGPTLVAEAILRHRAGDRFEVFSAGLVPLAQPDAALMADLAQRGFEVGELWTKPLDTWQGDGAPPMDIVVTLGERAAHHSGDWPGCPHRAAWRLGPDLSPAALHDDLAGRIAAFADLDPAAPPQQVQAALDSVALDSVTRDSVTRDSGALN